MKKSNYLHYLNQYQTKITLGAQKTFNHLKKIPKIYPSKTTKVKATQNKTSHHPDAQNYKQTENKENIHPNLSSKINSQPHQIKSYQPEANSYHNLLSNISNIIPNFQNQSFNPQKQIKNQKIQFQLSFTKCSFQPSHPSDNLFMIETQKNTQLIVCQKCSLRFTKRMKIDSFQQKAKYSYVELVTILEQLEQYNKKIKRIQYAQKQKFYQTIHKIEAYYGRLVKAILQAQHNISTSVMQFYTSNGLILSQIFQKNKYQINVLQKNLNQREKLCLKEPSANQIEFQNLQEIDSIFQTQRNSQIQLSCIEVKIPEEFSEVFSSEFKQSKFCIYLSNSPQNHQDNSLSIINNNQQIQQQYQQQQKQQKSQNQIHKTPNNMGLSPDFQKEIPFNIEYSASQQKQINFSKKMNDQLSKISSSEQLLIESLRDLENYPRMSSKICEKINFKTESSTHRAQSPKEQNSSRKRNFIKHLHIEESELNDLTCDEDLSLSSCHPIYQEQPLPRKSLKLSQNPSTQSQLPLTILQLTSGSHQAHKPSELFNPSLMSTNQNKHQISFQLDENMIIDANILPTQQTQENYDIISPAFKII